MSPRRNTSTVRVVVPGRGLVEVPADEVPDNAILVQDENFDFSDTSDTSEVPL
jgi:hypothetical protein